MTPTTSPGPTRRLDRIKMAERLERKAQNPDLTPEVKAQVSRAARLLRKVEARQQARTAK